MCDPVEGAVTLRRGPWGGAGDPEEVGTLLGKREGGLGTGGWGTDYGNSLTGFTPISWGLCNFRSFSYCSPDPYPCTDDRSDTGDAHRAQYLHCPGTGSHCPHAYTSSHPPSGSKQPHRCRSTANGPERFVQSISHV